MSGGQTVNAPPAVVVVPMGSPVMFREDDQRWYICGTTHVRRAVGILGWVQLVLTCVTTVIGLVILFVMFGLVVAHAGDKPKPTPGPDPEPEPSPSPFPISTTLAPDPDMDVFTLTMIVIIETVVVLVVQLIFGVLPAVFLIKASRNYGPTWMLWPAFILAICGSVSIITLNPFALIAIGEAWLIYRYMEYLKLREAHTGITVPHYPSMDYNETNAPAAYTAAVNQAARPELTQSSP